MAKIFNLYLKLKKHPVLILILVVQISIIIYINLFMLKYHLGYDCSAYYLQPMEMWKQKTLLPENWDFQTTLYWDSPVIFAVLFYGLFDNIFIAYGLANLISIFLLVLVLNALFAQLHFSVRIRLLFYILFFSPYVAYANAYNDLGYFNMMFISCGAYSLKIAILFFIWLIFFRINQEKITGNLLAMYIISICSCFVTGISSGYYALIFGVVPICFYYVFRSCISDKWLKEYASSLIYVVLCSVSLLLGKYFAHNILGFESRDSIAIWTNISQFFDNLFSIFEGYLSISGSLPLNWSVSILTADGIQYAFRLLISMTMLFTGFYFIIYKVKQNKVCLKSILLWILISNICVFVFCYTKYGAAIFEDRYLIPIFIILMMLFSWWIDGVLEINKNKSIKRILISGFIVCVLVNNLCSWGWIHKSQNSFAYYEKIITQLEELDSQLVYVVGDKLTGRNLRVLDSTRVYKCSEDLKNIEHWGDYTYFDENSEYEGATVLICDKNNFFNLPAYFQNKYTLINTIDGSNTGVYYSYINPVDFTVGFSNKNFSRDFMYTKGILVNENSMFNADGALVVNGINSHAFWGPYVSVEAGTYNFTLNYEIVENSTEAYELGFFDIAINGQTFKGNNIVSNLSSVIIPDVTFSEDQVGSSLEYRAYIYGIEGIKLKINSVEIERISK